MSVSSKILVEIAVHTIESALAAEKGGADRVEVFSNPLEGGVTPSEGLMAVIREKLTRDIHIMIRPRGGDFLYSDMEFEAMGRDIEVARGVGANGVVFGLVHKDGTVDMKRIRQLVEAARPLSVTFHRAFDACRDPETALEELVECGVDRVLTSGGEANAVLGSNLISQLVRIAGHRTKIVAAGGVNSTNVRQIVEQTGVSEVHAGLRSTVSGPMRFQNRKIRLGHGAAGEYERIVVREEDVRKLVVQAGRL